MAATQSQTQEMPWAQVDEVPWTPLRHGAQAAAAARQRNLWIFFMVAVVMAAGALTWWLRNPPPAERVEVHLTGNYGQMQALPGLDITNPETTLPDVSGLPGLNLSGVPQQPLAPARMAGVADLRPVPVPVIDLVTYAPVTDLDHNLQTELILVGPEILESFHTALEMPELVTPGISTLPAPVLIPRLELPAAQPLPVIAMPAAQPLPVIAMPAAVHIPRLAMPEPVQMPELVTPGAQALPLQQGGETASLWGRLTSGLTQLNPLHATAANWTPSSVYDQPDMSRPALGARPGPLGPLAPLTVAAPAPYAYPADTGVPSRDDSQALVSRIGGLFKEGTFQKDTGFYTFVDTRRGRRLENSDPDAASMADVVGVFQGSEKIVPWMTSKVKCLVNSNCTNP